MIGCWRCECQCWPFGRAIPLDSSSLPGCRLPVLAWVRRVGVFRDACANGCSEVDEDGSVDFTGLLGYRQTPRTSNLDERFARE